MTSGFFAYIRCTQQFMRFQWKRLEAPEVWYSLDRITEFD